MSAPWGERGGAGPIGPRKGEPRIRRHAPILAQRTRGRTACCAERTAAGATLGSERRRPSAAILGGVTIAYQGLAGAFSEAAAAFLFPQESLSARRSFADVFAALEGADVDAVVVPVENTYAGSVADVYDLLRTHRNARVVAEVIVRVRHCLLAVSGATLDGVRVARSHPQALAQCEDFLRAQGIQPESWYDTAGAARDVATEGDPTVAAIASRRAATPRNSANACWCPRFAARNSARWR